MRVGFLLLSAFALLAGLGLFLTPGVVSGFWPWAVTPLAARAVASWLCAFGVACLSLAVENDIEHGAGTSTSLFAFCLLELVVLTRYSSAIGWGKPLAMVYILFLLLGLIVTGANVLMNRKLLHERPSH